MAKKQKVTIKYQAKKKIPMKDLGKTQLRDNLRMVHPFLSKGFRTLKSDELESEKVFKELFGDEKFQAWKLRAIFEYQK